MTAIMDDTYTIVDLARLLRCTDRTIRRMQVDRQLPEPMRIRGMIRWRVAEITIWLRAGCPVQPEVSEE